MQGFRQQENKLLWESNYNKLQIEPWGRDSLRVRSTSGTEIRDDLLSVLLLPSSNTDARITIEQAGATISNGALTASISPQGVIRFSNTTSGAELLAETEPLRATRIPARSFKAVSGDLFRLEVRFQAYDGEQLYGLGQHQHGRLDQKGCTIDLVQRNTEVSIPFLLSSRGYGFLWHNPAVGRVELGYNETRWVSCFYLPEATDVQTRLQQEYYLARNCDILLEDVGNAESAQMGLESGVMQTMQLQDGEVMIRHALHHIQKWVDAPSVKIALS